MLNDKALEACPHCGSKAWLRDNQACGWRVECDNCQIGQLDYVARDEAIAAWNRRAYLSALPMPDVKGLVERLNIPWPKHEAEEVTLPAWVLELCAEGATALTALSAKLSAAEAENARLRELIEVKDKALEPFAAHINAVILGGEK